MKTKFWLVCSCLTVMLGCLFIGCKEKAEEQPEYPQDFHFTLVNGSEEYLSVILKLTFLLQDNKNLCHSFAKPTG